MIDFSEISKIKTKKDIKKYDVDKPLFISNYLFHYLIITDNLKAMKLTEHPIYKENDEGLQGYHLAAKVYSETKSLKMLKLLLKEYPEYSGNTNFFNETFLDYFPVNDDLIELIKEFKNVNWHRLLTYKNNDDINKTTYLDIIFLNGSKKLINFIMSSFTFEWQEFNSIPFFNLVFNKNLKTNDIIKILTKIKDNLNILNNRGQTIIYPAIESNNFKIVKFLIENNVEIDKYIPIFSLHPFVSAYEFECFNDKNDFKISKLIWDNIKDTHNFESTNKFGENIPFIILKDRIFNNKGCFELEDDILKKNTFWNKLNIDKKSIINVMVELPYEKYHKYLKNVKINKKQKDKNNNTILDYSDGKWLKFLNSLPQINIKDEIKINNYKYSHTNSFSSTILDTGIFFVYLKSKYKNLYIPESSKDNKVMLNWESNIEYPHPILNEYDNFAWIIIWENKYNYIIHPELNNLINSNKNNDKYDFSIVLLSLRLPDGGLHAEMIIYDFKNNNIERFDPYGNSYDLDVHLDEVLEEELTWNTGFNYINVKKYLPVSGLQTLSDENNYLKQKPGDFGGYCLAWCLWYVEHRMINSKYSAKQLISKLINKLLRNENSLFEYIRNYANNINKERLKVLKKIGIKTNKLTNLNFSTGEERVILNYIISNTTSDK